MPEDEVLVHEIVNGSQAAMEVLTRKYYKSVYAFVYRKVGDKETAYDLCQEIFIKVIQRIHSYSNKGAFHSWLFAIAINHCRDYWGSASYKQSAQQTELTKSIPSNERAVPYIFESKETREQVKAAINRLPEQQKEAVLLKYYHDMKISDIANATNASVPTVKSRLKQGLGKLAKLLNGGEQDENQKQRQR